MLLLVLLTTAIAYETSDIAACLQLMRWKIEKSQDSFDKILANNTLNPEDLIDKIVASMFESCVDNITPKISQSITPESPDKNSYEHLLQYPLQTYETQEDIELTLKQKELLEEVFQYTESIKPTNYYNIYLILSFSMVIIFVIASHYLKQPNLKKNT